MGVLFIVGVMFYSALSGSGEGNLTLVMAAMIGGYMAMNIGANDVANNVGPAVGSKALTLAGALVIAAIFEAAGALIAGGEVIGTIRSGIIDPDLIKDSDTFVWIMLAALLAGALWLNLATAVGAPVSTTHSIVGAVLGAGMAAAGPAHRRTGATMGGHRGELGDLAAARRHLRRRLPVSGQAQHHLSGGHGRGRTPRPSRCWSA